MALFVLGAVVSLLIGRTGVWQEVRGRSARPIEMAMEMIGEGLSEELQGTPRILLLRDSMPVEIQKVMDVDVDEPEEVLEVRKNRLKRALEKGVGANVEIVGFKPVGLSEEYREGPFRGAQYKKTIDKYRDEGIDVVISTVGLPLGRQDRYADAEDLALHDILFYADIPGTYDSEKLRAYIADGEIDGVSIMPAPRKSPERVFITRENLNELPE